MEERTNPHIIGIDPSGAYKEGKGTTGIVVLDPQGKLIDHMPVFAQEHPSQMAYWKAVIDQVEMLLLRYEGAVISIEDYVLYASSAKAQINSEMETSKLIGAITIFAFEYGTPLYIRSASRVINRWSNHILEHKKLIYREKNKWVDSDGNKINQHCLDALRHAVHCYYFEVRGGKNVQ